jgi:hypothetical protein
VTPPATPPDGDDRSVDVEAAWADIVSRWDSDDPPVGAWPASEDTDEDTDGEAEGDTRDDVATADHEAADGVEDWALAPSHVGGERVREAAEAPDLEDDDTEGYVPPEPPPLPRGDLYTMLAWGGVLGAPLFFLMTALFWRTVPQMLIVGAVAAFISGFVALVLRMPQNRDPDDRDDGAVV